jgi:hypothetical protein
VNGGRSGVKDGWDLAGDIVTGDVHGAPTARSESSGSTTPRSAL